MNTPIETIHLFPVLDQKLIELLRSLTPEEWNLPTVARLWTVKDVAAHLLDTHLRTLSIARDGYMGDPPGDIRSDKDLIGYLNRLNADWVSASKRISPAVLTDLLAVNCPAASAYMATLDPSEKAIFSVGWAGEEVSYNWFHIAREYTEKWHHQQQIREAVNKPGIMTQELYHPFLDTFMRALPFTYRHTGAPLGTVIQVTLTGIGGGHWYLVKNAQWELIAQPTDTPAAHTTIDGNVAWKLFSKSWRRKEVAAYVSVTGDQQLGEVVLDMVSVMA
ncbi:maleylpyruvate isomerase family mycothiol-dependent enzyme [Paraflavitalea soli]|uniref:Maleylpyruvate isomerase family mycothiol-dependent enzyme n=1 Tax=Paraflavitalea soli TaxID=2315862 RepID=A0A3B7MIY4_9BACT|nr:maleylpyruvate isomerase N-terminal domain-containing protein [Paraflavitalea soli]AXY73016.1 maleylpyruvate isomerase family mycothiol-dependent enzyme [Paraflavitalea soli]